MSIVVATYQPGAALHRVVDSLDAQTMPRDEFEVVFVDDGSPDDTFARLQRIASTRPNVQVHRIENSGWASRPRNVGIDHARGEYVMFMDHDDSLYPDGLRRAYEYARQNAADILSPKECKTNDSWWALAPQEAGNVPNVLVDGGIFRLMPMVPHKLYRRQLMVEHDIRFPEGSRVLWEDIFINISAYRHAKVVSLLADTPVYLWHASDTNSSHTFDPARRDFWDRLEELMEFVSATLDAPGCQEARVEMLAHQVKVRVLDRLARMHVRTNRRAAATALLRARRLLRKYASDDVLALLPKKHRAQVHLLRSLRPDRIWAFHAADLLQRSHTHLRALGWRDGVLRLGVECTWEPKSPDLPILRRAGDRVVRAVGDELAKAIPPDLLDVSEDASEMKLDICMRARTGYVAWNVPFSLEHGGYETNADGALCLVVRGEASVDIESGAVGAPLADNVWDFKTRSSWAGMVRKGPLDYHGPARPALRTGRGAVAYQNVEEALTLDLAGRFRTLAMDAKPRKGNAGAIDAFSVPLGNLAVFGASTLDAEGIVAIPDGGVPEELPDDQRVELLEKLAAAGELNARIVADGGAARLEGSASLVPGRYTIYARRGGKLHRTKRSIVVDDERQVAFD